MVNNQPTVDFVSQLLVDSWSTVTCGDRALQLPKSKASYEVVVTWGLTELFWASFITDKIAEVLLNIIPNQHFKNIGQKQSIDCQPNLHIYERKYLDSSYQASRFFQVFEKWLYYKTFRPHMTRKPSWLSIHQ